MMRAQGDLDHFTFDSRERRHQLLVERNRQLLAPDGQWREPARLANLRGEGGGREQGVGLGPSREDCPRRFSTYDGREASKDPSQTKKKGPMKTVSQTTSTRPDQRMSARSQAAAILALGRLGCWPASCWAVQDRNLVTRLLKSSGRSIGMTCDEPRPDHFERRTRNPVSDLTALMHRREQVLLAHDAEGRCLHTRQAVQDIKPQERLGLSMIGLRADGWGLLDASRGLLHRFPVAEESGGEQPGELLAGEHLAGCVVRLDPVPGRDRMKCRASRGSRRAQRIKRFRRSG